MKLLTLLLFIITVNAGINEHYIEVLDNEYTLLSFNGSLCLTIELELYVHCPVPNQIQVCKILVRNNEEEMYLPYDIYNSTSRDQRIYGYNNILHTKNGTTTLILIKDGCQGLDVFIRKLSVLEKQCSIEIGPFALTLITAFFCVFILFCFKFCLS